MTPDSLSNAERCRVILSCTSMSSSFFCMEPSAGHWKECRKKILQLFFLQICLSLFASFYIFYLKLSAVDVVLCLYRLDLVRGDEAPTFRHRDMDHHGSQTSCGLPGGFSAGLPKDATCTGLGICRGGRCPFARGVPSFCGVVVWGPPLSSAGPPQTGPSRPVNGEAGGGLVRPCCGGTHPQVGLITD